MFNGSGISMAQVIIVDDHPIVRLAIRFIVEKEEHAVIAETGGV